MDSLSSAIALHRLCPMVLGSGKTQLVHKMCAVAQAVFLETGSVSSLQTYLGHIWTVTTDLGTEFGLSSINPLSARVLFPWLDEAYVAPVLPDSLDLDDLPDYLPMQDDDGIGLSDSLSVPGLLHIIHNASKGLFKCMHCLSESIDKLAEVARLIRTPETRKRLIATCCTDRVSQHFASVLNLFRGHIHKERWGTVAYCTQSILALKDILQNIWSLERYQADSAGDHAAPGETSKLEIVNQALTCDRWWCEIQMVDLLMQSIRRCYTWAESCPCHDHLLQLDDIPPKLLRAWLCCPMRGRRLPEVASGDFMGNMESLLANMMARALLVIPASMSEALRTGLLQDLSAGRSHLVFQFTLKLAAMRSPPRLLFAIAHHNQVVARDAMRECLQCQSGHSKIRCLQQDLSRDAIHWLQGQCLSELPALAEFIGALKFGFTVERLVEGDHAAIHRAYGSARSHTESYDSLVRRLPELKQILADPEGFRSKESQNKIIA